VRARELYRRVQTLNKFAKNNELDKIKLYISMGANPDR
jgi:hypothetical protein